MPFTKVAPIRMFQTVQDAHLSGDLQYLCATSAYGVGIANPAETTCAEFSHLLGCCDSCNIKEFCSKSTEVSYDVRSFLLACSELNVSCLCFRRRKAEPYSLRNDGEKRRTELHDGEKAAQNFMTAKKAAQNFMTVKKATQNFLTTKKAAQNFMVFLVITLPHYLSFH